MNRISFALVVARGGIRRGAGGACCGFNVTHAARVRCEEHASRVRYFFCT